MRILAVSLCALVMAAPAGFAAEPGQTPKQAITRPMDQALEILQDPQYDTPEKKQEQRDKLFDLFADFFDFKELTQRTVGRNWRRFSDKQKQEFTDLFGRFIGNVYISKIQGNYTGQKIEVKGQQMLTDDKATVQTAILTESGEIPVEYSMHLADGAWRIYDVNIEGVSLVKNYRSQFDSILLNKEPADLIAQIKDKLEKQESGS